MINLIKLQVYNSRKQLLTAKTHFELNKWARENGIISEDGFYLFKSALLEHGINYDQIKINTLCKELDDVGLSTTKYRSELEILLKTNK